MTEYQRKKTRQIHIGPVAIGGGAPISVQSMTNTKTADTEATLAQIRALAQAGCDIVRLAVPDMAAAKNLGSILAASPVPLVADIHFDYKLALEAIAQGIHALRLNPGNIGGPEKVAAVAAAAKRRTSPSASASTRARSISVCSKSTAASRRRRSSRPRSSMCACSSRRASTT